MSSPSAERKAAIHAMPGRQCRHNFVSVDTDADPMAGDPTRGPLEACSLCPALVRRDARGHVVEFDRAPGLGLDGAAGEVPDILRPPLKRTTSSAEASA